MAWPFRSKQKDPIPTETPFGESLLEVHAETERLLAAASDLNDPQRCVLLGACAGSTVAVGGYGSQQLERFQDSEEYLPTNTGELTPNRLVQFSKAVVQEEVAARVGAVGRAYRVMAWALVADMAVFYWRPNYDLEISECAEVFGFSNAYEATIANIGRPGDDDSLWAEAGRRHELTKGALICIVAAALDEEIDPDDPLLTLGVEGWSPHFEAGLDTAAERIMGLAPEGLPIWRATDEPKP